MTYIDKLFKILIEIRQVVFAPGIFSNELLLALQQFLPSLL